MFAGRTFAQGFTVFMPQSNDYSNPFEGPIISPRPLLDVAVWLQRKYGKVITYEEAMPRYSPGLVQEGSDASRKWSLHRAPVRLDVSAILAGANAQNLPDILTAVVAAANTQIPTQHFILKSSKLGFHIIMDKERNQAGTVVDAEPLLDATVTVPTEERSVDKTFKALVGAITLASGVKIDANFGQSEAFSGAEPPTLTWGVESVPARDALISLLQQSATSLSWQLLCQASAQASDEFCALSTTYVLVLGKARCSDKTVLRPLIYDRCKRCPTFLPPPPCEPAPPPELGELQKARDEAVQQAIEQLHQAYGPAESAYFENQLRLYVGSHLQKPRVKGGAQ